MSDSCIDIIDSLIEQRRKPNLRKLLVLLSPLLHERQFTLVKVAAALGSLISAAR